MNQTSNLAQSNEIDLIELISFIWKQKWWVLICMVTFTVCAAVYAFSATERWTSKAEVIKPRNYEIPQVLKDDLAYARITDSEADGLAELLYQSFTTELRSVKARFDFYRQSKIFKKLTQNLTTEKEKESLLKSLASRSIKITWPDKKKEIDYPTISLTLEEPEDAQQALIEYLAYLNAEVFKSHSEAFEIDIQSDIDDLAFHINRTEERLPLERDVVMETKKKNLQRALGTAKAAGIKEYASTDFVSNGVPNNLLDKTHTGEVAIASSTTLDKQEGFLLMPGEEYLQAQISARFSEVDQWFLLGENYLNAQIDNIDKIPLIYPVEYYHKKTQLEQLEGLLRNKQSYDADQAFHYQSAPYLPMKRDKPKRTLIVLIGTIVGFLIGLIVALSMSVFKKRQQLSN